MMKHSLKIIIALFIITCTYSACKQNAVDPAAPVDTKALSMQIASSLYKSLTGQYGGANVNDGIKAPSNIFNQKGLSVSNPPNPLCGYAIDTAFNNTVKVKDSTNNFAGKFHFVYTCTNNIVNGYTVYDSLRNTQNGPTFSNIYMVAQNYAVVALDNTYKFVSMDGYIHVSLFNGVLNGKGSTTQYHSTSSQFVLKGLQVNFATSVADVTTGIATFSTQIANLDPTTPIDGFFGGFSGYIQFLGNHKAKLYLQTSGQNQYSIYLIDYVAGTVTAI
jgi:hypothetical protein